MGADPLMLSSAYDYSQIPYTSDTVDTSSDPFAGYYGGSGDFPNPLNNPGSSINDLATGEPYTPEDNTNYLSSLPSTYSGAGSLVPVDLTGDSSSTAGSSALPFGGVINTTSTAAMPRSASSSNLILLVLLAVGGFYLFESKRKK